MKYTVILLIFPLLINAQIQVGEDIFPQVNYEQAGWYTELSADGKTVIVGGQPGSGTLGEQNFSRARVYYYDGDSWQQKGQSLEITDFYNDVYYTRGRVALSPDATVAAIGSPLTGINSNRGVLKIYEYANDEWQQKGEDIIGEETDYLGNDISLSEDGDIVAVVAQGNNNYNSVGSYGYIAVYQYVNSVWQQKGEKISGYLNFQDDFYYTSMFQGKVSLSNDGNTMVIGCESTTGSIKVYEFDGTDWQLSIEIDNGSAPMFDGSEGYYNVWDVAISGDGNTIAAGNINDQAPGSVLIYEKVDGLWQQKGLTLYGNLNINVTGDYFGGAVSLSDNGDVLVVGASQTMISQGFEGRAKVYKFNGEEWLQIGENIEGVISNDYFGMDVSISAEGNFISVSSPFMNHYPYSNCGVVKVYEIEQQTLSSNNYTGTGFLIYPNPSSDRLYIKLDNSFKFVYADVYTALGQLVLKTTNPVVDITSLFSGSYYIKVTTDKGENTKIFIKQ